MLQLPAISAVENRTDVAYSLTTTDSSQSDSSAPHIVKSGVIGHLGTVHIPSYDTFFFKNSHMAVESVDGREYHYLWSTESADIYSKQGIPRHEKDGVLLGSGKSKFKMILEKGEIPVLTAVGSE